MSPESGKVDAVSLQLLPWTLYRELIRVEDEQARKWYEQEAKYLTYLPTKEQLIKEIEQQKLIFELQKQEG